MSPTSQILVGHTLAWLRQLPDRMVQVCCTSPPYWGLRSYLPEGHPDKAFEIGTEPTPEEYVAKLVEVFREVRRVLRDDGVLFLNLGDSYANWVGPSRTGSNFGGKTHQQCVGRKGSLAEQGLKEKDLVGIPWQVALALRADGWYLRADIIWAKGTSHQKAMKETAAEAMLAHGASPEWVEQVLADWDPYVGNCMPSSVEDRPATSHEYVFLLSKSKSYFYDNEAVREESETTWNSKRQMVGKADVKNRGSNHPSLGDHSDENKNGRNMRTVWTIPPQPFPGAHFATFPPRLVEPMIRAGSSEAGGCVACGAPWIRLVERFGPLAEQRAASGADASGGYSGTSTKDHAASGVQDASAVKARILEGMRERRTVDWCPSCDCAWPGDVALGQVRTPQIVLDPFCGSGTTGAVALAEGRSFLGIELNPEYAAMAERRIADPDFAKKVRREQKQAKEARAAEAEALRQRFLSSLADPASFVPTGIPKQDACMLILAHLHRAAARGLTCDELELALGAVHQSVSARVSELKAAGAARETGEKRETRTGARARVLVLSAGWGGAR